MMLFWTNQENASLAHCICLVVISKVIIVDALQCAVKLRP